MKIGVAPSLLLAIYCLVGVTSCGLHRPAESPHAGVDVPPADVSVLITMDFDPSAPGFLQAVQEGFVWVELVRAVKQIGRASCRGRV
jgi:hypothetical protein